MNDEHYMRLALKLAKRGEGLVSPNPMVGAVIVKDGRIIGKGYHKKAGSPHAEIVAIKSAKEDLKGSTLYVNLEPCVHHGKTPPCVPEIIKANISKVVISMLDPNPKVNGKGIEALKEAGISLKMGVLEKESKKLNEVFIVNMEKRRPFFIVKSALSLDGKIATKTRDSKWISSEESRKYVNTIREKVDGILVGINTVIVDNPMLVPRVDKPKKIPVRIVLDTKLRIPISSNIVRSANQFKTMIFTCESRQDKESKLTSMGIEIVKIRKDESGRVSLKELARELYEREIMSVLVEGGAEINGSLLKEGLVDKFILFYSPIFIGGKEALPLIGGEGVEFLKNAYRARIDKVRMINGDICVEGYVHGNY
ncbi:MAG: bifunctional diaminohydroxyphosphoribosylaminopyrimidine deaminase/5-amino-6-(5-phosphoribosylamino)uracil reductase RibD [Desulfobacterota bacterium]|nr:bifunctional diaminohydroxyphosphoribosylaminopyrimidine deaminase/5-amino-6-(5-phosphoribosylamino)uracil reductase RibD [Thermodesulfobacteriota bacterium]